MVQILSKGIRVLVVPFAAHLGRHRPSQRRSPSYTHPRCVPRLRFTRCRASTRRGLEPLRASRVVHFRPQRRQQAGKNSVEPTVLSTPRPAPTDGGSVAGPTHVPASPDGALGDTRGGGAQDACGDRGGRPDIGTSRVRPLLGRDRKCHRLSRPRYSSHQVPRGGATSREVTTRDQRRTCPRVSFRHYWRF